MNRRTVLGAALTAALSRFAPSQAELSPANCDVTELENAIQQAKELDAAGLVSEQHRAALTALFLSGEIASVTQKSVRYSTVICIGPSPAFRTWLENMSQSPSTSADAFRRIVSVMAPH